jgi:hypothetical protein
MALPVSKLLNADNVYNKVNKRMQKLFENFGEDFDVYQKYKSTIEKYFDFNINKKTGLPQISRGKANQMLNKYQMDALNRLLKMDTVQSLKKKAKQTLIDEGNTRPTPSDIMKRIEIIDYVKSHKDIITWISEQLKNDAQLHDSMLDLYNRAAGRSDELTYDELYKLMLPAQSDYNKYYGG